jgi:hypothetical protein
LIPPSNPWPITEARYDNSGNTIERPKGVYDDTTGARLDNTVAATANETMTITGANPQQGNANNKEANEVMKTNSGPGNSSSSNTSSA